MNGFSASELPSVVLDDRAVHNMATRCFIPTDS